MTACLTKGQDTVVLAIEAKIAEVCQVRPSQVEYLQVSQYATGDEFGEHHDWLDERIEGHREQMKTGGQRIVTFLGYLVAPREGGETDFQALALRVPVVKGSALIWNNVYTDLKIDHRTAHSGRKVVDGEKWIVTCWIRERAFDGSEEAAWEAQKKVAEETAGGLRKKLADLKQRAIENGYAEITATCARLGLKLVPQPQLSQDGRIGATLDLDVDPKSPVWGAESQ
jgi:hypothetical protein